jgi:hypothetical protein
MKPEEMLDILKLLQDELEGAESIAPEHRESLQSLTDEIQKTLASGTPANGSDADTLSQRMKESIIDFEVRHPIIGGLVERLTDGLSAMGI